MARMSVEVASIDPDSISEWLVLGTIRKKKKVNENREISSAGPYLRENKICAKIKYRGVSSFTFWGQ